MRNPQFCSQWQFCSCFPVYMGLVRLTAEPDGWAQGRRGLLGRGRAVLGQAAGRVLREAAVVLKGGRQLLLAGQLDALQQLHLLQQPCRPAERLP